MISSRIILYALLGALAALGVAVADIWLLRGRIEAGRNALAASNARVALMQGEVAACRNMVGDQNEQVNTLKIRAEAAESAARDAARAALKRPRRPLDGHGPVPMNAWVSGL